MNSQNYPVALALRGVSKRFDRPAVEALDLTVYGGEFYALVGPNGAGTTTTLRMVVGLLRPDAGSICIDGIDALYGALVHDPKLIILDEPLTGLDAASARQVKNVLRERVAAGGTVIMTTHILEVAERMADRIGVIAGGRLIAEGTLED